ncbi:MAG: MgtC/SapB family protein [Pseudohongiellaceae bacterium]
MSLEGESLLNFYYLFAALAIGLLIGAERGWKEREAKEGERVAGVRTFGLIGLLGGGTALLAQHLAPILMSLAFVGLALVLTVVYVVNKQDRDDAGITSLVAALVTFVLGALAGSGEVILAASAAVITTLLLSYKPVLHSWLNALEAREIRAAFKLLLISVVLLPILPNEGYGPWQALNPYVIWWMVVLIASISFVGYFAVKIGGARRGILFTGLFGGLASSTGLTLHLSRLSRDDDHNMTPILASGILLACGTMYPRMLLVASVLNPDLFMPLLLPTLVMALAAYVPALVYWYRQKKLEADPQSTLKNPLELSSALGFGLLLVLVMLLGQVLRNQFGDAGVLALAAASGVADVDAITLSLTQMSQGDLTVATAVTGIVIAAAVNTLAKGGMAAVIGRHGLGLRVGLPLLVSAAAGLLVVFVAG